MKNQAIQDKALQKLRNFNRIMGGLHLIQAIAMLFLAGSVIQKIGEFQPTITQNYLQFNQATRSLELTSKALFDLPFGILVALFLFISAGAHALISFPDRLNAIYSRDLARGINRFRWFEYALSSSIPHSAPKISRTSRPCLKIGVAETP